VGELQLQLLSTELFPEAAVAVQPSHHLWSELFCLTCILKKTLFIVAHPRPAPQAIVQIAAPQAIDLLSVNYSAIRSVN
jgi:hypothetical protein